MELPEIINFISSVGFPIVMCIFFFLYIREMNTQHNDEMNKMAEAINNNTLTMQKLVDKLDKE